MYKIGNVFTENERKGWIFGTFMPEGLQKDDTIEIKIAELDASFRSPIHYQKTATKLDIIWEGIGIWEIDGETRELHKGDYVIIPPLTKVKVVKILSEKIIVQIIKFPSLPDDKVLV